MLSTEAVGSHWFFNVEINGLQEEGWLLVRVPPPEAEVSAKATLRGIRRKRAMGGGAGARLQGEQLPTGTEFALHSLHMGYTHQAESLGLRNTLASLFLEDWLVLILGHPQPRYFGITLLAHQLVSRSSL